MKAAESRRVRSPVILQMEAVECGAAALGIVLATFGKVVPLAELRQACGVSRDGSKASKIIKAARLYGLEAKGYTKDPVMLKELQPPFIVFWQFNHFLVVEGWNRKQVFVNDPATGHRTMEWQEFDQGFTGVTLLMKPGPAFERGGRAPSLWRGVARRLRGSYMILAYCAIAAMLLVVPGLAIPGFAKVFLDSIIIEGRTSWFRPLLLAMVCAIVVQLMLKIVQAFYLRRLKLSLMTRMSSLFLWHMLRLPVSFYTQRHAGEISNRSTLNEDTANVLSGPLVSNSIDAITMIVYGAVCLNFDAALTCVGLGIATINFLTLRWIAGYNVEANMRSAQEEGKTFGASIAALQSMETLKSGGQESAFFARWSAYYTKAANAGQDLERVSINLGVLPQFLASLTTVVILGLGGLRVLQGEFTLGTLVAYQGLMTSFLTPVGGLLLLGSSFQRLRSNIMRLDDVLENPTVEMEPKVDDESSRASNQVSNHQSHAGPTRLAGKMEVRSLTFGYSPLDPPRIQDISFTLQPGQRLALVGSSGSGKSTIARVAVGLYKAWQGGIYFDGRPADQIPSQLLRHSVGFVDQDILLFEGSVRDNLTLWDKSIPHHMLMQACYDAAILDDILALPAGFDSMLPEGGATLSGGQRQRLEIARSLARNPSLLILDEATSALDAETEYRVQENIRRRGCSCLLVAHRLSTIRQCDEIIVVQDGAIAQRGTHNGMRHIDGPYRRLIQSEG